MIVILGAAVVLISIIGGYLLEKGNLGILFQPAEFVIIYGAALGSLLVGTPLKVIKGILKNLLRILKKTNYNKERYLADLSLLYELFVKIRKEGVIGVEGDVERPEKSPIFKKYPSVLKNRRTVTFICDTIKVLLTSDIESHQLDSMIETDIEINTEKESLPFHSISRVADSLPGLGIVAAVLGVIITMGKMTEPPEVLGHSIGAALVGTFLGVLTCYGFVGPLAANIEIAVKEEAEYYHVLRIAIISFVTHSIPKIAVEFGRRAIPDEERPSFDELEKVLKTKGK